MKILVWLVLAVLVSACVPKSDLDSANARIKQLEQSNAEQAAKIAELEGRLTKKPAMPVTVNLRKALLGSGYVAVFSTTIKQDFPVLVTVKSKSLGTSQQFRVNLTASGSTDLGSFQGASIEPTDELVIENQNYETATVKF